MSAEESQPVQFNLRIPIQLKRRLERSAAAQGRSVNRDTVLRLEQSLEQDAGTGGANAAILSQIAQVLRSASKAAGPLCWTEDRTAWELVYSTVKRLFRGWQPWEDENPCAAVSDAYERWKASTKIDGLSRPEIEVELEALELRREVIGLTDDETRRAERLKGALSSKFTFDGLSRDEQAAVKRMIESDQIREKFWGEVAALFASSTGQDNIQLKRRT